MIHSITALKRSSQTTLIFCFYFFSLLPIASAQFDFSGGLQRFGSNGQDSEVSIRAELKPATDARPAVVVVQADVVEGFYVYAVDQPTLPDGSGPMATEISLASNVRRLGPWQAVERPKTHIDQEIWAGLELREHPGQVTWFAPVAAVGDQNFEGKSVNGSVEGQACNPETCRPFEENFTAKIGKQITLPEDIAQRIVLSDDLGDAVRAEAPAPTTTPESDSFAEEWNGGSTYELDRVVLGDDLSGTSLIYYLLTAFLGGLILNVMPCVLPVIGLKVMSFVQQAGESRARALFLNCWYSAGIVLVFLILATLAVSLELNWGDQFSLATFNIVLIGVVFAMGLSLLGIWEIPIPGFVGAGTALELSEREGPSGAFLKGVLTTVLATPCTGPFMATALMWAVKQPSWMTYSVFGALGLGMASPFLLIGAFPELVRFLPKPGAWMETFKKVMGLVLMATVVWLMTFIEPPLVVPTLALLIVLGAACWWAAQTPLHASLVRKLYSWAVAGLVTAIAAMICFGWLYQDVMLPRFQERIERYAEEQVGNQRLALASRLNSITDVEQLDGLIAELRVATGKEGDPAWQPFSLEKLAYLTQNEGRTVLVDFTADWCLTCKTLEKFVLKTQEVEEALTEADVVTMEADYTDKPPEIYRTIKALGGVGVPLIAVFPASDPYRPIVFSEGNYSKADIIGAVAQATGQSVPKMSEQASPTATPTALVRSK